MTDLQGWRESIIVDAWAMSVDGIPDRPIGREEQIGKLRYLLSRPGLVNHQNAWLHGPSGTGKTAAARSVVEETTDQQQVSSYVNCWQHRTLYSVLQAIVDELRILMAEAQDTDVKFDRIRQALRRRPLIVILDEIDRPMPAQREEIIYGLLNLPNTGLVCIANSTQALATLDERVRSRLSSAVIEFPAYSAEKVEEILTDRANRGLVPGSWSTNVIRHIAAATNGDARIAIQILRQSAAAAEEAGNEQMDIRFVKPFLRQWQSIRQEARLADLSEHEKIIRQVVARCEPLGATELRRRYDRHCRIHDFQPVARRTFTKYLSRLAAAGVLNVSHRPLGTGGRLVRVA